MKKKIQIIPSGIPLVDTEWGGLYRGGTYLLIGARKTGRTLVGLQYAKEAVNQKEVCLFFTSMRPKDLMIQAASIDFDLQYYMNQNLIIVVRVAPPSDLFEVENPDQFLAEYLNDIATVVDQYQPNKIVFDELTPFIGFDDLNLLRKTFLQTTEHIEDNSITTLYIVGDPATPAAKEIVDTIASNVTGIVFLQKNENNVGGKITITPNIGHTQGQFTTEYIIEPLKGILVMNESSKRQTRESTLVNKSIKNRKYRSLADIDLPEEHFTYSNFYNKDDFNLILNNQIALYKSTGQIFTIISFQLDPEAERLNLLTSVQLQNSIRLSVDKKDKICSISNTIIILLTREESQKTITQLISKIKNNLPGNDINYVKQVMPFISVYAIKVDETVENADDILDQLILEEPKEKSSFGF